MPVYFFWGEDDFLMHRAIATLRDSTLDAAWISFNYDKIGGEVPEGLTIALNQAMTPPFGTGKRFIWLADTRLGQHCSESQLAELTRSLPKIPETSILLFSASQKPDGRAKLTKLLQKYAEIREFSPIPPWKTEDILKQVEKIASEHRLVLTPEALSLVAASVGNQTRQLMLEMEKLKVYWGDRPEALDAATVEQLVTVSTQNSLKLAEAMRLGDTSKALSLLADLLNRNEPALRIVSTLVGQFRTWLWVKLMAESGERDPQAIAQAAEIGNPKRVYFLQKEVTSLQLTSLQQALVHLLALESALKQGRDEQSTLQTQIIEITQGFRTVSPLSHAKGRSLIETAQYRRVPGV